MAAGAAGAGGHVVPGARHRDVPRSCTFCWWKMNFQCSAEGRRAAWAWCDLWRGLEERKVWYLNDRCWVPCLVWGLYRKEIGGWKGLSAHHQGSERTHRAGLVVPLPLSLPTRALGACLVRPTAATEQNLVRGPSWCRARAGSEAEAERWCLYVQPGP